MSLKEDLSQKVTEILNESWDERKGKVVPTCDGLVLKGGAVKLDATFLYADLVQSSLLATDFHHKTASKVIKIYLSCMCKLIGIHDGEITSFDGDRVMGVFTGNRKNTNATTCALKMNYVITNLIRPKLKKYFSSLNRKEFIVSHCVGIDTSSVFVVRAGQRGANDLAWIGRAPNFAAKLSEKRAENYSTYISEKVYSSIPESLKYEDDNNKLYANETPLPLFEILPIIVPNRRSVQTSHFRKNLRSLGLPIHKKLIWKKTQFLYVNTLSNAYRTNWYYEI